MYVPKSECTLEEQSEWSKVGLLLMSYLCVHVFCLIFRLWLCSHTTSQFELCSSCSESLCIKNKLVVETP